MNNSSKRTTDIGNNIIGKKGLFTIRKLGSKNSAEGTLKINNATYGKSILQFTSKLASSVDIGVAFNAVVTDYRNNKVICFADSIVDSTSEFDQTKTSNDNPGLEADYHISQIMGKAAYVHILHISKAKNGFGKLVINGKEYCDAMVSTFKGINDSKQFINTIVKVIVSNDQKSKKYVFCQLVTPVVQSKPKKSSIMSSDSERSRKIIFSSTSSDALQKALVVQYYIVDNIPALMNQLFIETNDNNCSIYLSENGDISDEMIRNYISDHSNAIHSLQCLFLNNNL